MLLIFSTPVLIRHRWQLKTVVFLHWCLICAVLLGIRGNMKASGRELWPSFQPGNTTSLFSLPCFNCRCACAWLCHAVTLTKKRPNLKLKTRPKQLLGYLPLAFVLPGISQLDFRPLGLCHLGFCQKLNFLPKNRIR